MLALETQLLRVEVSFLRILGVLFNAFLLAALEVRGLVHRRSPLPRVCMTLELGLSHLFVGCPACHLA